MAAKSSSNGKKPAKVNSIQSKVIAPPEEGIIYLVTPADNDSMRGWYHGRIRSGGDLLLCTGTRQKDVYPYLLLDFHDGALSVAKAMMPNGKGTVQLRVFAKACGIKWGWQHNYENIYWDLRKGDTIPCDALMPETVDANTRPHLSQEWATMVNRPLGIGSNGEESTIIAPKADGL